MKNAPADQAGGSVVRPEVETVCFPPRAIARLSRAAQRQEESADAPTVADTARHSRGYGKNSGINRPAVFIAVTVQSAEAPLGADAARRFRGYGKNSGLAGPLFFIAVTVDKRRRAASGGYSEALSRIRQKQRDKQARGFYCRDGGKAPMRRLWRNRRSGLLSAASYDIFNSALHNGRRLVTSSERR